MEAKKKKVTKGSNFCSDLLPVDLMIEIFRRLPVKTLTILISVSKLWASVIRNRDFMNLFLKESLNKPRGLVLIFRLDQVSNLSSEHPIFETHESSSSSPSLATYHVTCLARQDTFIAPSSVQGLICYKSGSTLGIYNPCTRRSITLPKLINSERTHMNQYLGFDPIDNDYKVLCVTRAITKPKGNTRGLAKGMWVLTLGNGSSWKRFNQDIIPRHSPISQDLCISGVLYYRAFSGSELKNSAIMSFDVRSERFHLIKAEKLDITIRPRIFRNFSKLTCYEGKLAVIFVEIESVGNIVLWVLEDAAREEWSRKAFVLPTLPQEPCLDSYQKFRSTDTNTGEIIFSGLRSKLDCVAYFDAKNNRSRKVYIEGKKCNCRDSEFLSSGQVENLMFL